MKNKKLVFAVIALVAVIAIMIGIFVTNKPQTTQGAKTITVVVVHSDASTKEFTYHTDEEFLAPVLVTEGLVEGYESQYGLTIETVDGEKASWEESQSYWALFIGEEYATTGASSTPVSDGDVFKLVYTLG